MKTTITCLVILLAVYQLKAQKINLNLPSFPNEQYELLLYYGSQNYVATKGTLNKQGEGKLQVPSKVNDYKGYANLLLANGNKLGLILNGEDFTITADAASFDSHKLFSSESVEAQLYQNKYLAIKSSFDSISNYSNLIPPEINHLREYTLKQINMSDLYSSSLWKPFISNWTHLETERVKNDSLFIADARSLMVKSKPSILLDRFTNTLIEICEQEGLDDVKNAAVDIVYEAGALHHPTGRLSELMKLRGAQLGDVAPNFAINSKTNLKDYGASEVILFFYESGCPHCMAEEKVLRPKYEAIHKKRYKLVSIASDFLPDLFKQTASTFPWEDKVCDPENKIFIQYGVTKTPTYFYLGQGNIIHGRYAHLKDLPIKLD